MGNLFFSSSKKISTGSVKKGKVDLQTSKNNNNDNNQNDNDFNKKLKKSSCDSSPEQQPQKIEIHLDVDDRSPTKSSPFQRDYLEPHEVLVPLEKYRPRRSNIRRSARQLNSSKNNSTSSNNKKFPTIEDNNLDDQSKESSINCSKDENSVPETSKDNNDDNNELPTSVIDELDPSERNKVARNKLSELLRRQKQVMPVMNNNHQRKYQSAYEPNLDYFNSINDSECDPVKNLSENNGNKNEENTESSDNVEEVMIRRPRKPLLTHGNALLIDELKKRQSNFYESSRESASDITTEIQQQPKTLITNNNCITIVDSN